MSTEFFELLKLDRKLVELHLREISDSGQFLFDFVAATWSLITEPGDTVAGLLRNFFGDIEALVLVVSGNSAGEIAKRLNVETTERHRIESALVNALEIWRRRTSQADVFNSLNKIKELGGRILTPKSQNWPSQLEDLGLGTPPALWVYGDGKVFTKLAQSTAVIGSRAVSDYGLEVTDSIVDSLLELDQAIISGGAIGVDARAHERTLQLGGTTVAVMAGGLDRLYPASNSELFKNLKLSGALISEVPPGVMPTKWRFLQRNRLIAALTQATVVIEAGFRSGTVNTVGHANDLDRPVGAVPGLITSVSSAGCHELIKAGKAVLISTPRDLAELLGKRRYFEEAFDSLGNWEIRVLDSLGASAGTVEEVSKTAGLTTFETKTGLRKLAALGLVIRTSNGWVKC